MDINQIKRRKRQFIEDDSGYGTAGTTTTTTLASQGGLLINIDSAEGDIATVGGTFIEDERYGFFLTNTANAVSAEFDTAVTRTGTKTLKASTTNGTGRWRILEYTPTRGTGMIPLKVSTKYRFSVWVKSTNCTQITWNLFSAPDQANFGTLTQRASLNLALGTTDWTRYTTTFTSHATDTIYAPQFRLETAGNVSDAWFDINSMTLEEVIEPVANSLVIPSPSLVSFTAVGSTTNIDQSFTTAPDGSIAVGDVAGLDYMDSQSFTATKNKLTGVYLYKRANSGTPTGNLKIDIRTDNGSGDPTGTILATSTIALATYNALTTNAEFLVNLPCNITAGSKYHIVTTNTANEAAGNAFNLGCLVAGGYTGGDARFSTDGGTVWTINGTRDLYFKTLYYKPTTNFKASQNNLSVSVSADEDGFIEGAVTNLVNGTYTWGLGASATDLLTGASVYSATVGAGPIVTTQSIINNYGFYNYAGYNWIGTPATTNTQDLIWKFTTTRPITGDVVVTFRTIERTGGTATMAYSLDNSSYTTMGTIANSANTEVNYSYTITGLVGETDFFLRFRRAGTSSKQDIANLAVSTTISTSGLSVLKNYPTNKDVIKQYSTTLGSATTTPTYRASKYGFPAIEYANVIDQLQILNTGNVSFSTPAQYQAQQIITTKSNFTGVTLFKKANIGSPTGGMTFQIVNDSTNNPGSTVYATYVMSNAEYLALTTNAEFTVSLPCYLPPGTYWIKISYSTASLTDYPLLGAVGPTSYAGLYKYGTDGITYGTTFNGDIYFKTLYSEVQFLDVDTTATGSTVAFSELGTTYTTVADGASLTISSTTTPNIFVKTNITANRLYLSSNDYNASSDKDGSQKQSVVYQVIQ